MAQSRIALNDRSNTNETSDHYKATPSPSSAQELPRRHQECVTPPADFEPKRREESRRGRHECLRHGGEYGLSYGDAAQTSCLPRWQSDRRVFRNIGRNTVQSNRTVPKAQFATREFAFPFVPVRFDLSEHGAEFGF